MLLGEYMDAGMDVAALGALESGGGLVVHATKATASASCCKQSWTVMTHPDLQLDTLRHFYSLTKALFVVKNKGNDCFASQFILYAICSYSFGA